MKRIKISVICVMVLVITLMSISFVHADQITLRVALFTAIDHPMTIGVKVTENLIERRTNGEIQVDIFPGGQLGNNQEILEGVIAGDIDVCMQGVQYVANYHPTIGILNAPYIFRDFDHAYKVLESEIVREMNEELVKAIGVRMISHRKYGIRHVTTADTPVKAPEDMKGLKLRCPDDRVSIELVKAMGASPTPMAFSEVYLGLQQGVVDGQENPIPTIISMNFHEVQGYLIKTGHTINMGWAFINENKWNSLTSEQQDIVVQAFDEGHAVNDYLIDKQSEEGLEIIRKAGLTIIEPDTEAFQKQVATKLYLEQEIFPFELYERIQAIK